ncbi:hypothetical protein T07_5592 [Trichinella nelsoni]|uniref:Uncharacterized protein n=1 Tax=Trichinella nelsoni TaxID=6336 RepID=A0A0V0RN90_9BILA|nr:hypothetical protein T07_5592 [Trichinella nelsoni]
MTLSRLRTLKRDPEKDQVCTGVICAFFAHGWTEEVDRIPGPPGRTWYLPYHAFYKDDQGERKCWDRTAGRHSKSDCVQKMTVPFSIAEWGLRSALEGLLADAGGVQPHVLPIPGYAGNGAPCAAPQNIDALTDMYVDDLVKNVLRNLPTEDLSLADKGRLWKTLSLHWNRLLAPFTIRAKRLFQSLWLRGLNWDDQLPLDINACGVSGKKNWKSWALSESCARDQVHHSEMHVFGDASEAAFDPVAYLMTESLCVVKEVKFVLAKFTDSIFHMGCALGQVNGSSITLSWIKGDPWRWMPFVVNRVQKIINLTEPFQWLHYPTADNPADKFSGGCDLEKLVEDHFWWNGPAWLRESEDQWPPTKVPLSPEEIRLTSPEQKLITVLVTTAERPGLQNIIDPGKHSKMERLGRITTYCLRFEKNASSSADERKSEWPLSFCELQEAEKR